MITPTPKTPTMKVRTGLASRMNILHNLFPLVTFCFASICFTLVASSSASQSNSSDEFVAVSESESSCMTFCSSWLVLKVLLSVIDWDGSGLDLKSLALTGESVSDDKEESSRPAGASCFVFEGIARRQSR